MKKIAVVILNWNGIGFLEKFLGSVVENSAVEGAVTEVVVADNGSTDGSLEWVKSNFGQKVKTIEFTENYGFTGGYNRALKQVEADYYLLLNSDIEVTPQYISPMFEAMEKDPTVVAAQPKILSYADRTMFEYAGASGGFIDTLGYPFCRGRLISCAEQDRGQYDSAREIFWATGAAFFVRAKEYHAIGGLDDHFFAHMEEIDLCWRFKRAGFKVMVYPESVVYHVGGGTLPAWSPMKTYLNFRNNLAMLYKNLSGPRFVVVLAVRVCTDSLRGLSYLISGKMEFVKAIYKGHCDFWRMRKKLDRQEVIGHHAVGQIYKGSIVLHYLMDKKFDKLM